MEDHTERARGIKTNPGKLDITPEIHGHAHIGVAPGLFPLSSVPDGQRDFAVRVQRSTAVRTVVRPVFAPVDAAFVPGQPGAPSRIDCNARMSLKSGGLGHLFNGARFAARA